MSNENGKLKNEGKNMTKPERMAAGGLVLRCMTSCSGRWKTTIQMFIFIY